MRRLTGLLVLAVVLIAAGTFLAIVPRWFLRTVSAPKSGAARKPTAAELERAAESAKKRKSE